jgi:hypothetical protein
MGRVMAYMCSEICMYGLVTSGYKKIAQNFPNLKMFSVKKVIGRRIAYLCSDSEVTELERK